MSNRDEQSRAIRLLEGIENGRLSPTEAEILVQDLDPVYIYVMFSFLRAVYPATDPAATAVLERVLNLTKGDVVRKHREGAADPISKWFEKDYAYADYRGRGAEMLAIVGEKLD